MKDGSSIGEPDDRIDRVRAIIEREPPSDDGLVGTASYLQGLCRVAARILPAEAVAVSLMTERGPTGIVAVLDEESRAVEEQQFVLGEGPCWDAFQERCPVTVADLQEEVERWPGYTAAVQNLGVRAAFSFPLLVGSARLGVLGFYRGQAGPLDAAALGDALALATITSAALIEGQGQAGDGAAPSGVEQALESSFPIYQAQGMVMVQLGVPLGEAMARLRAYAYAEDRTLGSVARDVVARTLAFDKDEL